MHHAPPVQASPSHQPWQSAAWPKGKFGKSLLLGVFCFGLCGSAYCTDVDPAKMKVQRCMILQFRELVEPRGFRQQDQRQIFLHGVGARSRKASIGDD
jgi:hypothetical protein